MNQIPLRILSVILFLIISGQVHALRCGTKLIQIGDRKHEVIKYCGEPTFIDYFQRSAPFYPYYYQIIDVWTYNFGSSKFMQELYFENGRLIKINELDYGY